MGIDLISISAHKMYGPKGVGALYLRRKDPRVQLQPIMYGGGHERGIRSGTLPVPSIVGFGKACQIARDRMARGELEQLKKMRDRLWERIEQFIPNVEFFGCVENRLPNTLGCGFEGANGETLLIALDMEGISVSTGSACSSGMGSPSPVLSAMRLPLSKINSSLRFSLGWGNTFDDIDLVAKVLAKVVTLNREKPSKPLKVGSGV